jgi:hypothetical protein
MYGTRDAGFFGYSHFTGGFLGGQAEHVHVPFGNVNLLPIPDNVTDEQVLYLSDVLPTSCHSVVDTGVENGDVVGIWASTKHMPSSHLRPLSLLHLLLSGSGSDRSVWLVGQNSWSLHVSSESTKSPRNWPLLEINPTLKLSTLARIRMWLKSCTRWFLGDGMSPWFVVCPPHPHNVMLSMYSGTFHEPKTMIHKIQKTLMLETDVPETVK